MTGTAGPAWRSGLAQLAARAERPVLRAIGLLSGTSADGVDAALVEVSGSSPNLAVRTLSAVTRAFPGDLRRRVLSLRDASAASLLRTSFELSEVFAEGAAEVVRRAGLTSADVDVIGSHGQTVVHLPGEGVARKDGRGALTLQIGDAARLRELTGVPVVHDFRAADTAAGGEGAPLVPLVDWLLLRPAHGACVALNVGGVANATLVTPRLADVRALDTGPGNAPLDAAVALLTDGRETFDRDGRLAARGRADPSVVARLLRHPALQRPPPRSLDRETFAAPFVAELMKENPALTGADLLATLTDLVAAATLDACRRHLVGHAAAGVHEVLVSGGGARNPALMAALSSAFAPTPVHSSGTRGVDPDAKEAIAFAVLACETVRGRPGNLPAVTGAIGPRVLGSIVV